ncbi:penicillin-binding protein [Niallia sp. 01092]|uniref:penicillin-binding protein n=1 Tax=unclassified Niallia TaxID=2837522 RepID=UPI003FD1CD09
MIRKQPNINLGAAIVFLCFCLLFFILIIRFIFIQATGEVSGEVLAAKAEKKYTSEKVLEASRGSILDRNGEVIAEDASSYKLVAITDSSLSENDPDNPVHVKNPEKTAKELAKYIDLQESEIYRILTKEGAKQVEFGSAGKNLSYETKKKIENLKLPGIAIVEGKKRNYPNGTFASHVIGFVEEKEDEQTGKYTGTGKLGVEQSLNKLLSGTDGYMKYKSDYWGYILPRSKENVVPAKNGNTVYLTLDKKIQSFLDDTMTKVDKEYNPEKMIAIVANPKTGEILAMSQRPTFNSATKEGINQSWHNEAIETSYEPGSTMKIFTLAAAVEEGVFNPDEKYKSGKYRAIPNAPNTEIHDHNRVGWGTITYLEGLQRSSNVAFAKIAKEKLGFDRLREYLTKFGFDQPTGIDLPHEANSSIAFTWPVEKVTTAYGQGTALTPIQQIQAATAIANNGKMVKPHVIDKIVDANSGDVIKKTATELTGNPISAATAKQVRDYLETVITSKNGTGQKYKIEGYDVAGKTGTASISYSGGYLKGESNYVFSFMGMAPKDDPELIMYVAVKQPQLGNGKVGSDPVSTIFTSVMKSSLQYMDITPSAKPSVQPIEVPDVKGLMINDAEKKMKNQGLQPIIIGKGSTITTQLPKAADSFLAGEKVLLQTDGEATMPNMIGWSLRDVLKVSEVTGIKVKSSGSGYVSSQSIKAGSTVKGNETLNIKLKKSE